VSAPAPVLLLVLVLLLLLLLVLVLLLLFVLLLVLLCLLIQSQMKMRMMKQDQKLLINTVLPEPKTTWQRGQRHGRRCKECQAVLVGQVQRTALLVLVLVLHWAELLLH
jgi:hypothetical protein